MRKRKADKDRKSVPRIVRLSKIEYEMVEKRASGLGMNVLGGMR